MLDELTRWRSGDVEQLWAVVHSLIKRHGKQLRPLLSLAVVDFFGGERDLITSPAASIEFYHLAALVLDDVQDNSEFRRGSPTVHASSTTSTAINVALFVRSLSYHMVHRYPGQDPDEKLRLHQELDGAATRLILGQSIDIGWHEGWYASYRDFPYAQMIAWKTGSLFGCAAAMGACVAGADLAAVSAARDYGTSFGTLYQLVDDYLDAFGDDVAGRPAHEDFREGKMTGPVIRVLSALQEAGRRKDVDLVLGRLADRGSAAAGWGWLLALMHEHGVADQLRQELSDRAAELGRPSFGPADRGCADSLQQLVDLIVAPVFRRL